MSEGKGTKALPQLSYPKTFLPVVPTWQGAGEATVLLSCASGCILQGAGAALEKEGQQGCGNCGWEKQGQRCPGTEEQPGEPQVGAAAQNGNGTGMGGCRERLGLCWQHRALLGSTLTLPGFLTFISTESGFRISQYAWFWTY